MPKVVNTFGTFFYLDEYCIFIYRYEEKKNIHFVSFIDFNLYICHNLNIIRRKIRLIQ